MIRGALFTAALALLACAGKRVTPRPAEPVAVTDDSDPEIEVEAVGDAATSLSDLDAGCATVPRNARCLPAGMSALGVDRGEAHFEERPPHAVRVGAFAIDKREVSARSYLQCVAGGHCREPSCPLPRTSREPARCVSWSDASAYCARRGGRLPSEVEWERAAAGLLPERRRYAWGNDLPDGGRARDVTPDGLHDLSGGVAEWVIDGGNFYPALPRIYDAGADGDAAFDVEDVPVHERTEAGLYVLDGWQGDARSPWRVARGGHDGDPVERRVTTQRRFRLPDDRLPWIGFRCAYSQ